MNPIKNYLSLIKFSHTIFAMPFALMGFFIATKRVDLFSSTGNWLPIPMFYEKILLVVLCMVFARSAAMAFNRYLDRKIDAINPRTIVREIPSGKISPSRALGFTIICCFCFIASAYLINSICFYLSFVALFVVLFYSYTKRFTFLCHVVLGIGLSLAPIGAYLAVTGVFNILPLLFSALVICWVSGFDVIYALQDEDFDAKQSLYSIPVRFGLKGAMLISHILHIAAAAIVVIIGLVGDFGVWFWMGGIIFVLMLFAQHRLVKPNDLSRVNLAFMTTNGVASVLFALFTIIDLYL